MSVRDQPVRDAGAATPTLVFALVLSALLATVPATLHGLRGEPADASARAEQPPAAVAPPVAKPLGSWPAVTWHSSRAVGRPNGGRLVRGVQLPPEGEHFFTWDPILKRPPNRAWRRWGTDQLVRVVLTVISDFRSEHPEAPRVGVTDLSRPKGGEFGSRFGGLGHASHQNGLDVDVLYPRLDRLERRPLHPSQIDRVLSQELVDRFVAAGAQYVFVGPRTAMRGRARVVQSLVHHDDHMHVRLWPSRR